MKAFQNHVKFAVMFAVLASSAPAWSKPKPKTPAALRTDYITRLQQYAAPPVEQRTVGSLWSSQNSLGDLSADYKARHLNDTITIHVAVQTTAAQSGTVDTSRAFATNSAI